MTNTISFTRVNNDANGNPRYVCHFLNLLTNKEQEEISDKYAFALKRAKKLGGKKFHNKQYGGGICFQSYNLQETEKEILSLLPKEAPQAHLIPNYHFLTVKHVPATNYKAAKVRIHSERFNQTVFVSYTNYPGSLSPAIDTAIAYLTEKGFNLIGKGESENHYYLIADHNGSNGFTPLKPIN